MGRLCIGINLVGAHSVLRGEGDGPTVVLGRGSPKQVLAFSTANGEDRSRLDKCGLKLKTKPFTLNRFSESCAARDS